MPSNAVEPLYLSFPNPETCATWQALLKSYAIPEIYGRWYFPSEGGSYRMWRQVDLTVIQGRNLGLSKPETGGKDDSKDGDNSDIDVSCEIHLNSVLCSRTTVKRSLASPDWHENFNFPGLPPFENLEIVVWRERKMSKPVSMGSTRISLSNFRRGEPVEGWFPVVQPRQLGTESRVGDLRLKIRVDEYVPLSRKLPLLIVLQRGDPSLPVIYESHGGMLHVTQSFPTFSLEGARRVSHEIVSTGFQTWRVG